MRSNLTTTIVEHGVIAVSKGPVDYNEVRADVAYLDQQRFDQLERFILDAPITIDGGQIDRLLTISYRRGLGKVLVAQNYVGVIQLKGGHHIEILPKIHLSHAQAEENTLGKTRRIFLGMLKTLRNTPFKRFRTASLRVERMPLIECFITMFLDEVRTLLKIGLRSGYTQREENSDFIKGRLMVAQNIRHNPVRRNKLYITFQEFSRNRPENRLIKATIQLVSQQTRSPRNRTTARELLLLLDPIPTSSNITGDLNKCTASRLMTGYRNILQWCRLFLKKESMVSYRGNTEGVALMFPMAQIFESWLSRQLMISGMFKEVYTQDSTHWLATRKPHNTPLIRLRPDILAVHPGGTTIIDAKWKLLKTTPAYHDISTADLYQLLSYGTIYSYKGKAVDLVLAYPLTSIFNQPEELVYQDANHLRLRIVPVDIEAGILDPALTSQAFQVAPDNATKAQAD